MTSIDAPDGGVARGGADAIRLALKVLFVGLVCHLSTEFGFAIKSPPHYISPLWPTGAILFSVLVVAPVRHWWAYILAAYCTSVINDARAGFPASAFLFIAAGLMGILIAAILVRRFAAGARAFASLRNLAVYLLAAVGLAPCLGAFVAAFAGRFEDYWFYWRVWFLAEALAYLTLAPAILTLIGAARNLLSNFSPGHAIEACLIGLALIGICVRVFMWPMTDEGAVAALVYLPLPVLLWATVRFGPIGLNTCLMVVAFLSISGAVQGRGPFATGTPGDSVLALQLFLVTVSIPLMLLAAVITEGRETTNALRESEARFRSLADTAPVMIWMSGTDKRCVYFNQPWLDFTGRTMQQELGDGWVEGVFPEDVPRCISTYVNAFDARAPFEMEYRLRRKDGEYRWIIDRGVPRFAPDGALAGYIGTCLDITERKRAAAELQEQHRELMHLSRVAIVGELSGALAHELNQPLTAILSNAQAAQRRLSQEPIELAEIREILADIVDEDKRAGAIIQRLRALLKKGETRLQSLDLNEVVSEALDLAHADLHSRGINVSSNLAAGLPAVRGDRVQLQQVLLNLLANACDAMTHLAPQARKLCIVTQPEDDQAVRISVADCGCGISAESSDALFKPFFTTKAQGLGLGLTICRSIVVAHGGRLWADNNPAGGATFRLTLPIHNGEQA